MPKSNTVITVIDDLLAANDPLMVKLEEEYEVVNLLRSPNEGVSYLKENLNQKNIVLLDYLFGKHDPKGNVVLKEIREETVLIPVIIFTANGREVTEFQDLINNHAFAFVNKGNYPEIIAKIKEAEVEITNSIEGALEEWILLQDKEKRKEPYMLTSEGKEYSLNEILKELREQTEVGQSFEKDLLMLTIDLLLRKKESL